VETVEQVGFGFGREQKPALFQACTIVLQLAAIVHAIQCDIEVGPVVRLSTKIYVVGDAALAEQLGAVSGVVTAVDSPIVTGAHHIAAARTVADVRRQ